MTRVHLPREVQELPSWRGVSYSIDLETARLIRSELEQAAEAITHAIVKAQAYADGLAESPFQYVGDDETWDRAAGGGE